MITQDHSDAAMEEALHGLPLLRHFAGLDAGMDTMPDETTILNFLHRLERHGLSKQIFAEVSGLLISPAKSGGFLYWLT